MKRNKHYIVWLLGLALTFNACDKIEPEFFDEDYNGAYFDYQYASDYEATINFGEYIVGNPQSVPFTLNVKLLGYLTDEQRTLSIKTRAVEDFELAKVTIPEVVFANKEYQKEVEIIIERPEVENTTYAITIYLDGEGDLGTGITGKNEYTIYVKEEHGEPSIWNKEYLGNWDREKHTFLANLMNDDYYYKNFKINENVFDAKYLEDLNILAVNTLLAKESQEPISVGIPIMEKLYYNAGYDKPYFWDNYKEYLGLYSSSRFYEFTRLVNSANTQNIIHAYENANEKMEEKRPTYHKEDFLAMLNAYYEYAKLGYNIEQYKDLMWVEIEEETAYTANGKSYLRIPYWWEDPDNLGTGEIINKLFGEYNDEKYQFIIKTILKKEGSENFVVATILPFIITENGYGWDEKLNGKERLKECYKIITEKKANVKRYKIPEVDPDEILSEY